MSEKTGILRWISIEMVGSVAASALAIGIAYQALASDIQETSRVAEANADAIVKIGSDISQLKTEAALQRQSQKNIEKDIDEIKAMLKDIARKQ